ncbi:oxidoreductase [Clostridium sp. Marseille-P2415]|uniref:oxidoreductase n=1 Tax=Clostridium sp. Marseille-P2415 TaxID=1805471 RepID=UPI00228742A6|nr:tRNA-dihydrouridine synthase [Clostridium sp. Marseille-P2415]
MKKRVSVPVYAVGGITTVNMAGEILQKTGADMVDIGRGTLVNPNWANDAKAGKDVGTCFHCKTCMWRVDPGKCPGRSKRNARKEQ